MVPFSPQFYIWLVWIYLIFLGQYVSIVEDCIVELLRIDHEQILDVLVVENAETLVEFLVIDVCI